MQILTEQKLVDFEFWGGAKRNAFLLTYDELDQLEGILEDLFEGLPTDTLINDMFRFDFDFICELLNLTYEDIDKREEELLYD